MPTLGDVVRSLEEQLFVGRDQALAAFQQWLASDASRAFLSVSGPAGIGKSFLLERFAQRAGALGRQVISIDGRGLRPTPSELLAALGGDTSGEVACSLNRTHPLVLIDSFEELADLTHYLQEELLPGLDWQVKFVIASRRPLGQLWKGGELWQALVQPLPLDVFSLAEAREYLRRRGIADEALAGRILAAAGRLPLALSLAADLAEQLGTRDFAAAPEWHFAVRLLVERLLEEVRDQQLRSLLEACAVVHQFDEAMLEAVSGEEHAGAAFRRLCALSIVQPGPHGLLLHDDVRHILAEDLSWRHRRRYDDLRRRALAYLQARLHAAPAGDRAWLLLECLSLCEQAFIQSLVFGPGQPGEVSVEPGTDDDIADALAIEAIWHNDLLPTIMPVHYGDDPDGRGHLAFIERALRCPGRRFRIARDRQGNPLGYSLLLPLYRAAALLAEHGGLGTLVEACCRSDGPAALPPGPEGAATWYCVQLTHRGMQPEAVCAVLWRDFFAMLAREETYVVTLGLDVHRQLFEALGFERVPGARHIRCGVPHDGYVLDLSRIGLERWIEAIVNGQRPPQRLTVDKIEAELHALLPRWTADAVLAASPLATLAPEPGAAGVRRLVQEALARAGKGADVDLQRACRAVELAYLVRAASHERLAERLAVSRTTFYRLLKRGTHALAQALAHS